ncbi:MAG: glycosyltransferase family 39 protein, partial [Verrucomicrobia bacterium]|nr:glycosyltransferase family 39 protein [Verrucomicrobiota bacterium]
MDLRLSDVNKKGLNRHFFFSLILYLGVIAALIFDWTVTEPSLFKTSPYEGWDECMAYTQASRLSLTNRFRNATYGSIEEFKFRIAEFIYKNFDPIGKKLSPRRWTNNVLSSYQNPSAIFDSPSFDGTYSRGILDRRPFLIARIVNIIGGLLLAGILCGFWLRRYGYQALFLVLPLLWILVGGYWIEAGEVAPNAWNALLAIMFFVCLIDVVERRRPAGLYISAALLGFGANSKIDFLFLGGALVIAWVVADFEAKTWFRRWIRPALVSGVTFLVTLVLTNPRLLYALPLAVSEQLRLLGQVRGEAVESGTPRLVYNCAMLFTEFLGECIGAPWDAANVWSLSTIATVIICVFFPLSVIVSPQLAARRKWTLLAVLVSFYVFLWLMPLLLAGDAHDRYFLSGSAIAMVSLGYGCLYLWRGNSRLGRFSGAVVFCLCAVFYLGRAREVSLKASEIKSELTQGDLNRTMSRNQAVLEMIKLIESGNYSKRVIIDQHSNT